MTAAIKPADTVTYVSGSAGHTSKSSAFISRVSANADANPHAAPIPDRTAVYPSLLHSLA